MSKDAIVLATAFGNIARRICAKRENPSRELEKILKKVKYNRDKFINSLCNQVEGSPQFSSEIRRKLLLMSRDEIRGLIFEAIKKQAPSSTDDNKNHDRKSALDVLILDAIYDSIIRYIFDGQTDLSWQVERTFKQVKHNRAELVNFLCDKSVGSPQFIFEIRRKLLSMSASEIKEAIFTALKIREQDVELQKLEASLNDEPRTQEKASFPQDNLVQRFFESSVFQNEHVAELSNSRRKSLDFIEKREAERGRQMLERAAGMDQGVSVLGAASASLISDVIWNNFFKDFFSNSDEIPGYKKIESALKRLDDWYERYNLINSLCEQVRKSPEISFSEKNPLISQLRTMSTREIKHAIMCALRNSPSEKTRIAIKEYEKHHPVSYALDKAIARLLGY